MINWKIPTFLAVLTGGKYAYTRPRWSESNPNRMFKIEKLKMGMKKYICPFYLTLIFMVLPQAL